MSKTPLPEGKKNFYFYKKSREKIYRKAWYFREKKTPYYTANEQKPPSQKFSTNRRKLEFEQALEEPT